MPIGKLRHSDIGQLANGPRPICFGLRTHIRPSGPRQSAVEPWASGLRRTTPAGTRPSPFRKASAVPEQGRSSGPSTRPPCEVVVRLDPVLQVEEGGQSGEASSLSSRCYLFLSPFPALEPAPTPRCLAFPHRGTSEPVGAGGTRLHIRTSQVTGYQGGSWHCVATWIEQGAGRDRLRSTECIQWREKG